jgi:predicted amidophosphoribosyltransferase
MSVNLEMICDSCRGTVSDGDEIYCSSCFSELENEKEKLETEVERLKEELNSLR